MQSQEQGQQVKVWDPLVRVFHWSLAAGFVVAYLSAEVWLPAHTLGGYFILGLIAIRLVWGFVGPQHARFSDFVRRPTAVIAYLKEIFTGRPARYLGHNPAGGAMVVALLISLFLACISGLALYGGEEFSGPLAAMTAGLDEESIEAIEEVHEFFANFTVLLIGLHLLGVLFASIQHGENLPRSMVTGYKHR